MRAQVRVKKTAFTYSSIAVEPIRVHATCATAELTARCHIKSRRTSTGACSEVLRLTSGQIISSLLYLPYFSRDLILS